MITPGQILENPVTGERFRFTHTAASTGGELLGFDFALRPGGAVPIPHVHPIQTERFEVVSGLMRFRLGWRTLTHSPAIKELKGLGIDFPSLQLLDRGERVADVPRAAC